jgi:hypothetical protein
VCVWGGGQGGATHHDVQYKTKTLAALLMADLASFDMLIPSPS